MRASRSWRLGVALGSILLATCAAPMERDSEPAPAPVIEDARVDRVWHGLVPLSGDGEPQWDERATLAERMRSYGVPGVGLAVLEGHRVVWRGGFGSQKSGEKRPVTEETLFHAGSIAKCVSAAAVLGLVAQGRLELDAPVNDSLVSWRIPESRHTATTQVTLRHLLSHSGGIQDGFTERSSGDDVPSYFSRAGEERPIKLQDLLDAKPGVDVDGPTRVSAVPGSGYRYANADYVILELLVEDLTGEPFAAFMDRAVLRPLGMASSTYHQPLPAELRARAAVEHDLEGRPIAGDRLHIPLLAAGGLWTTPTDLAVFIREILAARDGEPERLLPAQLAREMLTRQIGIPGSPLAEAAGLGFELAGEGDGFYIEHTGGTWGSTAIVWAYPTTGDGVVIMTNSAAGSFLRIEILLAVAREFGWPFGP